MPHEKSNNLLIELPPKTCCARADLQHLEGAAGQEVSIDGASLSRQLLIGQQKPTEGNCRKVGVAQSKGAQKFPHMQIGIYA